LKIPSRRVNLSDTVADQILNFIIEHKFKPEDKLPTESELSEQFDVSRTVIREAMRKLRIMNVIVVRQGDGTFMSSVTMKNFMDPLLPLLVVKQPDEEQIFKARLIIEPGIAVLCANRFLTADAQNEFNIIEKTIENMATSFHYDNIIDFSANELKLKLELAVFSKNVILLGVTEAIAKFVDLQISQANTKFGNMHSSFITHKELISYIKTGDAAKAEQAVKSHLEKSFNAFFDNK
jgi:GntR family transcriptional regulator, transcriptional repressor for pyruvate dehydrogenase complex